MPSDHPALLKIRRFAQEGRYQELIAAAAAEPAIAASPEGEYHLGIAYAACGRLKEAEATFENLLRRAPAITPAKAALCKIFFLTRRPDRAAPLMASIEAETQNDPQAAFILADLCLQAGQPLKAYQIFRRLKEWEANETALTGLAEASLRIGRGADACAAAKEAFEKFGMTPGVLSVLGAAAHAGGDQALWRTALARVAAEPPVQAAAIYEHWTDIAANGDLIETVAACGEMLVAINPSAPRFRQLAEAAIARLDGEKGLHYAERAVEMSGGDSASLALFARCKVLAGDIDEAKTLFRRAIEIDPNAVGPYDHLSQLDARLLTRDDVSRLAGLLQKTGASRDADRIFLTLGRFAEAKEDYAKAYDYFARGKALAFEQAKAGGALYDERATEQAVERVRRLFPSRGMIAQAAASPATPIFIVGMPRSGTSLVEQILASHPDVSGGGELKAMPELFIEFSTIAARSEADAAKAIHETDWAARYFEAVPAALKSARFFTDKHPLNFWAVGLIKTWFPTAKIIQLKRQPQAVFLSNFKQRFYRGYSFANDVQSMAHYTAAFEALMRHWRSIYDDEIYVADYEALTRDLEDETRRLLAYCGLEWNEACLSFHTLARDVYTHSAAQVREKIHDRSVEHWRKYGDKLKPFEEALEEARRSFGLIYSIGR